jgi:hypothetical protein
MPMLRERLQPHPDVERRAVGRTTIDRDVLMYISRMAFTPAVSAT